LIVAQDFPAAPRRWAQGTVTTHFSAIFRYAKVGVKRSAGIEAVMGSRFGGNCEFLDFKMTSCAVWSDGTLAI
jgi:hypothetical protein